MYIKSLYCILLDIYSLYQAAKGVSAAVSTYEKFNTWQGGSPW